MDEGSGTTISDASGGGNTGQIQGASWTTGKYGKALSFNGTSSYVDLGAAAALKSTGSMSWTAWVYAAGNPPDDGQIIALSDDTSGWQFKTSPDTGVRTFGVAVSGTSGTHTQRYSKTVLSLNTWYHVAGVYNASAKTLDIYVNGVLDNGVLVGTVPASQLIPAINPTIGKRVGGFYFNGIIDNLRVYTRALSASEVQADMKAPISSSGGGSLPTVSSVQCSPTSISSGGSSKCTVSLSAAAPSGGSTVALSDNSTALTIPSSVTVAAGASSATFTATAGSVTTTQSATITASLNGKSATASITISASSTSSVTVAALQCSLGVMAPGSSATCTVSLSAAAPSGGSTVALSDNSTALTIPSSVTVAAGASSATFTATAGSVTTTQSVTITASLNGTSITTSLTIQPSSSTAGLAAAYAFDEGSGSTISDSSGNGNTGQIQGAAWSTTAKYGKAMSFNGTSSYIDLGNPASLQSTGSMTWSAWIYATGNPPDDGQIIARSNDSTGWQFKTSPDTGVRTFGVAVSGAAGSRTQRYSKTVLALNKWYHVAGVYDASAKTLNIYVNGVLDNGVLSGTVPAAQVLSSVNTTIGKRSGGYYFQGVIDNLRIYNRALTATEVQSDMNTAVPVKTAATAIRAAAQQDAPAAASARTSSATSTAVPRSRMHLRSGGSMLSCSPRIVNAGGTATCEIKGLVSSTPAQIAVNSSSSQVRVPAAVLSRPNQNSLTFQASVDPPARRHSATITATLGDATITDTIDVLPGGPVLTAPDQQIAKPGAAVNFTVTAADSTDAPVQLAAKDVPSGASFDAASGRFDWTPAESQMGVHVVTFTGTNAAGQSSTARVTIDVDSGKPSLSGDQFACSPNSIGTLHGKWLASAGAILADPSGATTNLGGTQVTVNGSHVPVLSATPTDVRFLCPALDPGASLSVAVETPAGVTNSITAEMKEASPSIFSLDGSGRNQGTISFQNTTDVAMARNFQVPAHPAQPGDQVLIWTTGLGQNNSANGISVTFGEITVNAEDVQPVSGYAGVYVVRATVPPGVGFSDAAPVHIAVTARDGQRVDSNTVTAAIEAAR
jgi:uncharacterized protein (TIGR03437 family)